MKSGKAFFGDGSSSSDGPDLSLFRLLLAADAAAVTGAVNEDIALGSSERPTLMRYGGGVYALVAAAAGDGFWPKKSCGTSSWYV